ncbi:DUF1330 domain-containing protein [Novosphingobium colocasiae]|uniref:DUF1330 domain-containing protein n=1 Tax=Novosphingobium colocasiae TaxID=1256513 RepID=UPI0035B080FF
MQTIAITDDAWSDLSACVAPGVPIVSLNLLRFRDTALYPEGSGHAPCSGRTAYYDRYANVTVPIALTLGGKLLLSGSAVSHPVCPPGEHWDDILMLEYPDIGMLLGLGADPAYREKAIHRTAALRDSRLLVIVRSELAGGD